LGLIGNQNVINKSLAYFYGAPASTGAAATGVQFAIGKSSLLKASFRISQRDTWYAAESSSSSSHPDGYNIGEAIFPAFTNTTTNLSSFTRIEGLGELTATAILARLSEATLSGSGDISQAELASLVTLAATLAGDGVISQADLQAVSNMAATLAGSGTISQAALSASVPMEATLSGTGSIANTTNLTGIGRLEAAILPFTELSPENLALAVMNSEVETGYNVEAALRLILSGIAGKLSGAPGTTITIRSVTDGTDRIVATVDSNGNRSSLTYDVGDE
jgi:hypothetical protein